MPWRCPGCRSPIAHHPEESRPRVGQRYRCHVCRVDLEFDANSDKLMLAEPMVDVLGKRKAARARLRKKSA